MERKTTKHLSAILRAGLAAFAILLCGGCSTYSIVLKSTPPENQSPYAFKFYVEDFTVHGKQEGLTFIGPEQRRFIQSEYPQLLATRYPDYFTTDPVDALPVTFAINAGDYQTSEWTWLSILIPCAASCGTLPLLVKRTFPFSIEVKTDTASANQVFFLNGKLWATIYSPIGMMIAYQDNYDYGKRGIDIIEEVAPGAVDQNYVTQAVTDTWLKQFVYAVQKLDRSKVLQAYERLYGVPPPPPQQEVQPADPESRTSLPAPEEKAPKKPERVFFD